MKGGDLKFVIQEGLKWNADLWRTSAAPHYALQLLTAVKFLHQQSIVHADLKPENCTVTETGRLRLVDFGSAFRLENKNRQTTTHNHRWASEAVNCSEQLKYHECFSPFSSGKFVRIFYHGHMAFYDAKLSQKKRQKRPVEWPKRRLKLIPCQFEY